MESKKELIVYTAIGLIALVILFVGYKLGGSGSTTPVKTERIVFIDSIVNKTDTLIVTDTLLKYKTTKITETVTVKNPLDSVLLNQLIVMQDSLKTLGATQILTMDTTLKKNNITTSLIVKCDKIQNWISVLKYDMSTDTIHYEIRTVTLKDNSFHWNEFGFGALGGFCGGLLIGIFGSN